MDVGRNFEGISEDLMSVTSGILSEALSELDAVVVFAVVVIVVVVVIFYWKPLEEWRPEQEKKDMECRLDLDILLLF